MIGLTDDEVTTLAELRPCKCGRTSLHIDYCGVSCRCGAFADGLNFRETVDEWNSLFGSGQPPADSPLECLGRFEFCDRDDFMSDTDDE